MCYAFSEMFTFVENYRKLLCERSLVTLAQCAFTRFTYLLYFLEQNQSNDDKITRNSGTPRKLILPSYIFYHYKLQFLYCYFLLVRSDCPEIAECRLILSYKQCRPVNVSYRMTSTCRPTCRLFSMYRDFMKYNNVCKYSIMKLFRLCAW